MILLRTQSLLKYGAVGRITIKNQFAYIADQIIRSLFLLMILYVFVQLWTVTYAGVGASVIAGYRFDQIIWYLIVSESIYMSTPKLVAAVEDEVKSGGIAYRLSRPMSYLLYHYAAYLGEAIVRLAINLALGGCLGLLLFGLPDFGWGLICFWPVAILAYTVNFTIRMTLALSAFWIEEAQGLALIYDKLLFTIGGMMLPIELFPQSLRAVCAWLPFQTIVYFPAKMLVQFDSARIIPFLGLQSAWLLCLGGLTVFVYRKGVRRLHVNGG